LKGERIKERGRPAEEAEVQGEGRRVAQRIGQ